jgi:hypothetical protein
MRSFRGLIGKIAVSTKANRTRPSNSICGSRRMATHAPGRRTRHFYSDNNSGIHPQVLEAIIRENASGDQHVHGYGEDPVTLRAAKVVQNAFGGSDDIGVFFMWSGTGANVLSVCAFSINLDSDLLSFHSHLISFFFSRLTQLLCADCMRLSYAPIRLTCISMSAELQRDI